MTSMTCDVIVVGGGLGGTMAAIASAKAGAETVLVEESVCLGGTATQSMITEINGSYKNGHCMLTGTAREMMSLLEKRGAINRCGAIPMTSNPDIFVDRIRFQPEQLKLVLDQMVKEAGVRPLFLCNLRKVEQNDNGVSVTVGNIYENLTIQGEILVDATGNSDAVYLMDPDATEKTNVENRQGMTIAFSLGNVDLEAFQQNLERNTLAKIIQEGVESGALPFRILASAPWPGSNMVTMNLTRVAGVDCESIEEMSQALIDARAQIEKALPYLKSHLQGCEHACLSGIAAAPGIRERRKIVGCEMVRGEDLIHCRDYLDAVAVGCYPVDIHRETAKCSVQFIEVEGEGIYQIPYHSMVCDKYPNVLAGGKNIYADDIAYGALRTMPSVMGIGNAAGLAAAKASRTGADLRTMDISDIQEYLRTVDYPDCGVRI